MRKAMRVMKEQAAEMAQRASAAAAAAARERAEADAALGEARTALASERGRVAELQVCSPLSLSLQAAAAQELLALVAASDALTASFVCFVCPWK